MKPEEIQTQNEYIYALLVERGDKGICSEERFNGGVFAGQLPRCISDLENKENPKRNPKSSNYNPFAPKWELDGKIEHRKTGKFVTYILHPEWTRPNVSDLPLFNATAPSKVVKNEGASTSKRTLHTEYIDSNTVRVTYV